MQKSTFPTPFAMNADLNRTNFLIAGRCGNSVMFLLTIMIIVLATSCKPGEVSSRGLPPDQVVHENGANTTNDKKYASTNRDTGSKSLYYPQSTMRLPSIQEFRGVWLTTVSNLDWPASPGLHVDEQKNSLRIWFDALYEAGFNAVFFQVRTEGDALYASPYEPWSWYLTGEQGKAPEPFYDPLELAIELAHERGMELHAWLNPYRLSRDLNAYPLHETHALRLNPDWVLTFRRGSTSYAMLNPARSDVRDYIANIVTDIVRRYKVDGIHFDDYFYPYSPPITTEDQSYFIQDNRGFVDIGDWRRDNINLMIAQVRDSIASVDPLVSYGVSPFAIRLNTDAGTNGSEGYHMIFADPLNWIRNRTIDYIAPQIYWETNHPVAPYGPVLDYWARVSHQYDRHIYVGLAPYRLGPPQNWDVTEIGKMLDMNRKNMHPVQGSIFFRAFHSVNNHKGLTDSLRTSWMKGKSTIPYLHWKAIDTPIMVQNIQATRMDSSRVHLEWVMPEMARRAIVYRFPGSMSMEDIMSSRSVDFVIGITGNDSFLDTSAGSSSSYLYMITVTGRNSPESDPVMIYVE